MAFDFSTLVTDRSPEDLQALRDLLATPMSDWTAEQKAEFNLARSKGAYNYTDLNRVTACMDYLNEVLTGLGYVTGYQRIQVPHTGGGSSILPDGYIELEYVKSTGTQYINTNIYPTNNTRVVAQVKSGEGTAASYVWFFGCQISWGNNGFGVSTWTAEFGSSTTTSGISLYDDIWHTVDFNRGSLKVDDEPIWSGSGNFQTTIPMYIFGLNGNGILSGLVGEIGTVKIYENNALIRDFVPCKNPSEEVGLYDTVGKQFYGNSGTGEFVAGPEAQPESGLDPYTWYENDIPIQSQMVQYLSNVINIWSTIMTDPSLPETMDALTQQGANQIEAALLEVNTAIEQIVLGLARSAAFTFWSGNRPFPCARSDLGRIWAELDDMGTNWANWQVATWYLLLYGNLEAEGVVT